MKLRYFAHSAFGITTNKGEHLLIDPFLDGNPNSPVKSDQVKADYILLSHAHGDHFGDTLKIAKKQNSLVICVNELADYCASRGLRAHNMHIGGSYKFNFGKVKFTIAHHGSLTPDNHFAGPAAGILLFIENKIIYHTGDTGLFYDMKLIGEMNKIDVMLCPIGDNFTMGIEDAVKAVEFINPKMVIPTHYNTFEVIENNPLKFKEDVEKMNVNCRVLEYGEEIDI